MTGGAQRGKVRTWLGSLSADEIRLYSQAWVLPLFGLGLLAAVFLPGWAAAAVVVWLVIGVVAAVVVVLVRWGNDDADHLAEERHWFD